MKVLIIGAAGMIGRKLTARLVRDGKLAGKAITNAHLVDVVAPQPPANAPFTVTLDAFDIAASYVASKLVAPRPDIIFLLASVVYGAPFPDKIGDEFLAAPLTSHGTQKAICELWLADYSRRGFFDGIGLRLPTICVRPGLPNKAASGFFSWIIREPLAGKEAILPVGEDVRHWHASPRAAVEFLLRAAELDLSLLGARRSLNLPGVSVTVGEQIEALRAIAGDKTVALIRHEPDETIIRSGAGGGGLLR